MSLSNHELQQYTLQATQCINIMLKLMALELIAIEKVAVCSNLIRVHTVRLQTCL